MSAVKSPPRFRNLAQLLDDLGVPADRVCYDPAPGHATKADLLRLHGRGRLYELIDGTLVEKPMGHAESFLALEIGRVLANFVRAHGLGYCTGADDLIEFRPGQVRGPDVSFVSWLQRPDHAINTAPISAVVPALVVEVLSPSNTPKEIARKLGEYFTGGGQLAWVVDGRRRTVEVYTAADEKTTLDESGTLDGGQVVPGFGLPLTELFADFPIARKPGKKGKKP